jgi:hypothetical protein
MHTTHWHLPRALSDKALAPVRNWLEHIDIQSERQARCIVKVIPAACPFERDIYVFGHKKHIPAMCKLNPFFDQLQMLRFKALCYLAER